MAAASLVPATAKLDKDAFFEGLKAAVAACSSAGSVRVTFKSGACSTTTPEGSLQLGVCYTRFTLAFRSRDCR